MPAVRDVAEDLAAVAGYLATKAVEPAGTKLYELESDQDRQREDAARLGPPYEIAAKEIAGGLGKDLQGAALDAAMFLIVDETLTPMLGFSAPNRAYPLATHVRASSPTWSSALRWPLPPRLPGPPAGDAHDHNGSRTDPTPQPDPAQHKPRTRPIQAAQATRAAATAVQASPTRTHPLKELS